MLGIDRYHHQGIGEEFLTKYGPNDSLGRKARDAEAERLLQLMDQHELEVQQREQEVDSIQNQIDQMNAAHRVQMDYLISFGVRAEHRAKLRQVLQETMQHQQLTPRQAVQLANCRARFPDQSSNGLSEGVSTGPVSS